MEAVAAGSPYPMYSRADHAQPQAAAEDASHEDRPFLRPWMVVAAILVVGAVIAAIVGLSGPDIPHPAAPPAAGPTSAP